VLRFLLRFLFVVAIYAAGLILLKRVVAPNIPVPTIVLVIVYFVIVPIVLRPLHNIFRERHPGTIIKEAASRCLCPSCGYALEGLLREHDNRIVCPDCSAAWLPSRFPRRVRRYTQSFPPMALKNARVESLLDHRADVFRHSMATGDRITAELEPAFPMSASRH
jgi:rubredoxin